MRSKLTLAVLVCIIAAGCSKPDQPIPSAQGKIIVLMYHRIVKADAANLYERSVINFENDLKYIVAKNFRVISFKDLESITASGIMPSGNSVILTFDDGDESWFSLVRPLLLQYNMKATFFLWTDMIGHNSYISWNEVNLMSNYMYSGGERPFIFGSHTCTHQNLLQLKAGFGSAEEYKSFLSHEFSESRKIIESHITGEVSALALPYGNGTGDQDIISEAVRNGYKFIRTSTWGAIDNPVSNLFEIPSVPMLSATHSDFISYYLN